MAPRARRAACRHLLCAEIALLPIGAFVFSRVTFAGLIVNFAAIPLMTLVQIAGMAAVALTWVDPSPHDGPDGSRILPSRGSSAAPRSSTSFRGSRVGSRRRRCG